MGELEKKVPSEIRVFIRECDWQIAEEMAEARGSQYGNYVLRLLFETVVEEVSKWPDFGPAPLCPRVQIIGKTRRTKFSISEEVRKKAESKRAAMKVPYSVFVRVCIEFAIDVLQEKPDALRRATATSVLIGEWIRDKETAWARCG